MSVEIVDRTLDTFIFDVDGTFYSQAILEQVFAQTRNNLAISLLAGQGNIKPIFDEIDSMLSVYLQAAEACGNFLNAFVTLGGQPKTFHHLLTSTDRSKFLNPNPALKKMLTRLSYQTNLAILTGAEESNNEKTCKKLLGSNWRDLFSTIICIDTPNIPYQKPQPEVFSHILNQLNTKPKNAVMIGDTGNADLKPAKNLGMFTIQVEKTDFANADLYIPSILHLRNFITTV